MNDITRAESETKAQTIRAELKQWETSWAKTHDGKKPSREDIKQNPDIAQKYKSYNKLRDILSGKLPPPSKSTTSSPSRKRKSTSSASAHPPSQTPSKRLRTTPSVTRSSLLPNDHTTPSFSRKLFISPASAKVPTPTSIGPTPQRDGRVLGLFDLLSGSEETPSRPRTGDFITLDPATDFLTATPRKTTFNPNPRSGSTATPAHRHGRTPMSTSKRALLDKFLLLTPLKNRDGNAVSTSFAARIGISSSKPKDEENGQQRALTAASTPKGPQSASKSLFATPAFLKRGHKPLDAVDETGEEMEEVRPLRLPRKPIARGLSSLAAGLRKLEEEKLDEEMDVLREIEMEAEAMEPPTKRARADDGKAMEADKNVVEVGDSQVPEKDRQVLLGGFDDEALLDSDVEEQLDRGQPMRVFKKKGQKRTTRRVNMKPTRMKRPTTQPGEEEDSDQEDDDVVPETQIGAPANAEGDDDYDIMSASDYDELGDEWEKKAARKSQNTKEKGAKGGEEKEGTVKKAVRKVKATANANFKRLKLRNYGAKGGPGMNSRFRRRR